MKEFKIKDVKDMSPEEFENMMCWQAMNQPATKQDLANAVYSLQTQPSSLVDMLTRRY